MSNLAHGSGLVKGGAEGDRKLTAKEMDEKLKDDENMSVANVYPDTSNIIVAKARPKNKKIIKLKADLKTRHDARSDSENKYADDINFCAKSLNAVEIMTEIFVDELRQPDF